jgi:hypothetical protein
MLLPRFCSRATFSGGTPLREGRLGARVSGRSEGVGEFRGGVISLLMIAAELKTESSLSERTCWRLLGPCRDGRKDGNGEVREDAADGGVGEPWRLEEEFEDALSRLLIMRLISSPSRWKFEAPTVLDEKRLRSEKIGDGATRWSRVTSTCISSNCRFSFGGVGGRY